MKFVCSRNHACAHYLAATGPGVVTAGTAFRQLKSSGKRGTAISARWAAGNLRRTTASVVDNRVTGGSDGLSDSDAVDLTADNQTGTAAGNELNGGRFHSLERRDSFLNSLDTVPAGQAFNSELNVASANTRGGGFR